MKKTNFKNKKTLQLRLKNCGFITLIFLGLGAINTNAQETINVSGGNITSTNGTINQSVGQLVNNTMSGSNGTIYQGVEYAIQLENLNTNSYQFELSVKAFPNPSTSELNLQVSKINSTKLSYKIYDLAGKLISASAISEEKTTINIEKLPNAVYQLSVFSNNQNLIKSFKIIKN